MMGCLLIVLGLIIMAKAPVVGIVLIVLGVLS